MATTSLLDAPRSGASPHAAGGAWRRLLVRLALAYLALNAVLLGLWATLAPHSWFDDFPGGAHHWIAVDGPYNRHLAGDVGALFLALAVVTIAALVAQSGLLTRVAGIAWTVSGVPHAIYHLGHSQHLSTSDQVASVGGVTLYALLGLVCVLLAATDS